MEEDPVEVAVRTCESSADLARDLVGASADVSAMARSSEPARAGTPLADVCDALLLLVHAFEGVSGALGDPAASLRSLAPELLPWLNELVAAQERQDWLRMADLLDYEVSPLVRDAEVRARSLHEALSRPARSSLGDSADRPTEGGVR